MNDGEEEGNEGPFFCFRSNLRVITRLETLATQANVTAVPLGPGNETIDLLYIELL